MKKEKMYCPKTMGTFKMMFGFPAPTPYRANKWKSIAKNKDKKEQ